MINFDGMYTLTTTEKRAVNGKEARVRKYVNGTTGNELTTYHLYTDRFKNEWWTFEDLFNVPFIRQLAAKKVVDLYGHGLTLTDVTTLTTQIKLLLKTNEADKYERVYAKVLELESLSTAMADPVKQCIGLSTLYLLIGDERPDAYSPDTQRVKFDALALDIEAQAFFLTWWTGVMQHSGQVLKALSLIASTVNRQQATSTPAPSST